MTVLRSSNFDAEAAGPSANWTAITGDVYQVQVASSIGQTAISGTKVFGARAATSAAILTDGGIQTDQVIWAEFTVPSYTSGTDIEAQKPMVRHSNDVDRWRYFFAPIALSATTLGLELRFNAAGGGANGSNLGGTAGAPVTAVAGEIFVCAGAAIGNVFSGYLWKKGTARPTTPTVTYTDVRGQYRASGYGGFETGGVDGGFWKTVDNCGYATTMADLDAAYAAPAAPVLSSPSASATSATTANATVSTNTASGTVYCLVNTSATATVSAIKAGGVSQAVSATGTQTIAVSGLTASTAYYAHFAHNANSLDSTAYDSVSFSTPALPAAVLSSPAGTPTSTTTATATVSTTVGSGTLYFMVSANTTETATTIKASGASQAVSASGTQNVAFSGLSASTLYYTHFVQVANAQDSNVANGSGFTTPSVSAAVLSSPSASAVANTTATANVTTNTGSGTLYCLASANPTETVATIKASGVSKTVTATGAQTFSLTGLTQGTQYYLHFVQTVTGVDSGVSNSSSFTTTAPTVTFTPVCALKAVADGALAANVAIHAFVHDKTTGALVGTKTGLNSGSTAIPPAFTASFGVSGTQYDVKFVDDANALRRSLEAITPV